MGEIRGSMEVFVMRPASLLPILLLAGTGLSAQQANHAQYVAPPQSVGCPVSLTASRPQGLAVMHNVADGQEKHDGPALDLRFSPISSFASGIREVEVIVHGDSGKSVLVQTGSGGHDDASETFSLERAKEAATLNSSEIWPKQVRNVRWVEVTKIVSIDGKVWQPSDEAKCRTGLNGFMLVGATAH